MSCQHNSMRLYEEWCFSLLAHMCTCMLLLIMDFKEDVKERKHIKTDYWVCSYTRTFQKQQSCDWPLVKTKEAGWWAGKLLSFSIKLNINQELNKLQQGENTIWVILKSLCLKWSRSRVSGLNRGHGRTVVSFSVISIWMMQCIEQSQTESLD